MKKLFGAAIAAGLLATSFGCAYGGVATTADGKVVIARNDGFLFGVMRAVYVCKVTDTGVTSCAASEAP